MTDTKEGGAPPRWDTALAAVVVLLVVVLALGGAQRSRALTVERRAAADERALAEVATGVAADLTLGLDDVSQAASGSTVGPDSFPGAQRHGPLPADGAGGDDAPLSSEERSRPEVTQLLERSRDSGSLRMSPPLELGGARLSLVVEPVYRSDPAGSSAPPTTPEERRQRLEGWFVAGFDLAALTAAHAPEGTVAAVRDGGTLVTEAKVVPRRLPSQVLEIAGRRLEVVAGDPDPIGLTAPTLALLVVGLLAAGLAAAAILTSAHRSRVLHRALAKRDGQMKVIGDVAPLVQQSLDLADVLPSVAVQLSDHFGLAGVRVLVGTSDAGQLELFSVGERPDPSARPVLRPPASLAAGTTLALGLQRGGRSVALLQLVSGRALDGAELESLRALTELVAAAIVNASLYSDQQKAMVRLRELDALKTVFLSTASHELRTPATVIGGFAALLADSWDRFSDQERRDFARRIAANARSLSAVVQDLLDLSVLDRDPGALVLADVDLAQIVDSVLDRLEPALGEHHIKRDLRPAPPVRGELNGIERVLTNLLTNAAKFSPAGSVITVGVGADPDGGGATLVVSDQGPGVPLEERAKVFTRFFRGSGEAVAHTRGVGIGLSVVADLVGAMDGRLEVDDAPGGGARFTVHLPAAQMSGEREVTDAPTA